MVADSVLLRSDSQKKKGPDLKLWKKRALSRRVSSFMRSQEENQVSWTKNLQSDYSLTDVC
jgi:hypothetical protein